jgi:hypothetical protein
MLNIETDDPALIVVISDESVGYLFRIGARRRAQIDTEGIGVLVIMKLYVGLLGKPLSGKALCTVYPSRGTTQSALRFNTSA